LKTTRIRTIVMDSAELVGTLERAGLSPYQAEAYVALLEYGATSATELASASDVPKPRIYDVLEELEDRGYVETYEAGSLHARAHSPADVMEDLRARAGMFESAAEEVEERWEQPSLESNRASIVKRFQTVYERASMFVDGAQHQVHLSLTPEEFTRLRPRLVAAHDRGVSVRVSIHTKPGEDPPDLDFRGACWEARHRRFPAPFVTLVDRRKTCFAHHPDAFEEYGVLVDDRTHAHVFHWYFRTALWDDWETLYVATGDGPVEYLDIRQCARDLSPLIEAGADVRARVEGYDIETGENVELEGRVREAVVSATGDRTDGVNDSNGGRPSMAGQVSLVVETDDGATTVGGWGSMLESVEATHITVLEVISPDGTRPEFPPSGPRNASTR
jgi:sugar-specific transcriptional regulator TrmB